MQIEEAKKRLSCKVGKIEGSLVLQRKKGDTEGFEITFEDMVYGVVGSENEVFRQEEHDNPEMERRPKKEIKR